MFFSVFTVRESLGCWRARRKLSAYVDGALPRAERREVAVHLRECKLCGHRFDALAATRAGLKRLPRLTPSADLQASLLELAGRESVRRRTELTRPVDLAWHGLRVRIENLMRPLALPFAGGIVSALVLFSMLVPAYPSGAARVTQGDVPTALYTDPTVKSAAPFSLSDDEVVVDLVIDGQGRVVDYTLPATASVALRREVENNLLFTQFNPAMAFGQPQTGRIRLSFRRTHVDVKG